MVKKHKNNKANDAPKIEQTSMMLPSFEYNTESLQFRLLSAGIIIISIFLMYSNIYDNTFQFDDILWLENPAVINFTNIWDFQLSRIAPFYTFALNYQWFGNETWGYSLINVSIHVFNSLLVWTLLLLTFRSPGLRDTEIAKRACLISFIGAMLFALHPLQTQAVTYIYQRLASMAAFFYLLAITSYVTARMIGVNAKEANLRKATLDENVNVENNKKIKSRFSFAKFFLKAFLYLIFLLSFLLGAFTKENTFTLPLIIFLFELFFLRKKLTIRWTHIVSFILFIGILAALAYIFDAPKRMKLETDYYTGENLTNKIYLLTQFRVLLHYLRLFIFPIGQNVDYEYSLSHSFWETDVLLSVAFHLILIVLSIILYRKNRLITFGILWFYVTIAIESSIIPISDVIMEHRTYLPMFGLVASVLAILHQLFWRRLSYMFVSLFVIILIILSALTFLRNMVWQNDLTLWNDVINKSPGKARGYNNRGIHYLHNGQPELAIVDFSIAIDLKQHWRYNFVLPYKNRGIAYFLLKRFDEAIADFDKYIELHKWDVEVYNNRANCYMELKQYSKAIEDYNFYLRYFPDSYIIHSNLGLAYFYYGNYSAAIQSFSDAIAHYPQDADSYVSRGDVYMAINEPKSALSDYRIALIIEPNSEDIQQKIKIAEKSINER